VDVPMRRVLFARGDYDRDCRRELESHGFATIECSVARVVEVTEATRPDLVMVGPDRGVNVVRLVAQVRAAAPDQIIITLSDSCDVLDLLVLLRAGVTGMLPSSITPEAMASTVSATFKGEAPIPRRLVRALADEFRCGPSHHLTMGATGASEAPGLSEREWDVFCLLHQELSTGEIAERLFVSQATVRSHVASIKRKLGVADRASLLKAVASW